MAHLSKRVSLEDQTPEYGLWVVVTILAAIVVVSGVAAALVILVLKDKQQQSYSQVDPMDSQPSSAKQPKKMHNMSVDSVLEFENEDQRNYMIRKSLAGRMAPNESHVGPATHMCREDRGERENPAQDQMCQIEETGSLVKDWKEFEAGLRRHRSRSPRCHPSVMMPTHPPPTPSTSEPFIRDSIQLRSTEVAVEEEGENTDGSERRNAEPHTQVERAAQTEVAVDDEQYGSGRDP